MSLNDCLSQAAAKIPSGFVTFDSAAKPAATCEYGTTINGYILGNSEQLLVSVRVK